MVVSRVVTSVIAARFSDLLAIIYNGWMRVPGEMYTKVYHLYELSWQPRVQGIEGGGAGVGAVHHTLFQSPTTISK